MNSDRDKYRGRYTENYRNLKESNPCTDCGKFYKFYQMQYDHRPEEIKRFEIGKQACGTYSWRALLQEIAKCDLVCANCHAERTWQRTQHG